MQGREKIYEWISKTRLSGRTRVKAFLHDWVSGDEERGWGSARSRTVPSPPDPGDGEVYQAYNLQVLKYAGNNEVLLGGGRVQPAKFAPVVKSWLERTPRDSRADGRDKAVPGPGTSQVAGVRLQLSGPKKFDLSAWRSSGVTGCVPHHGAAVIERKEMRGVRREEPNTSCCASRTGRPDRASLEQSRRRGHAAADSVEDIETVTAALKRT